MAFPDGDESEAKTPSESQGVFKQVVSIISALFPESRPRDVKPVDPASWFRGLGDGKQRDPKVFLVCFDLIRCIMSEVEDRLLTSARGRKKAVNILPSWGDIYKLCYYPDLHKAPPVNNQFSILPCRLMSDRVWRHVFMGLSNHSLSRPGLWPQFLPFSVMPIWLRKTRAFKSLSRVFLWL